ncbi:MAG TPA: 1,2-phenylacetyl-CoA epoxidase subunit PaaD [Bacteroidia bacterium]|nr:1,2-phenylacetyl-CoA epoxidase subunit PaaD [Bacteroidia bacterium]
MVTNTTDISRIRSVVSGVCDPEIPVLTIEDLGILRDIRFEKEKLVVEITPTFTGCPAMRTIADEIADVLRSEGFTDFDVRLVYSPAWTTDWISESGKLKLKEYGIAPPARSTEQHLAALLSGVRELVHCPFCNSANTRLTSPFGSTACKALHYCDNCHQPFEEFKCH